MNKQMKYSIQPAKDGTHIVLRIKSDFTGGQMMERIIEAHDLGKKLKTNRYLVDVRGARNIDTTLDNYHFAHADMKKSKGVNLTARVAALVSVGDHSHDFIETVLYNAGYSLKIFHELKEAKNYLKE